MLCRRLGPRLRDITEPNASTIQVVAQKTGLPYYFGKVVGLTTYSVSATANAGAGGPVGTVSQGLFPVGLQCTAPCNLSNLDPGQSVFLGSWLQVHLGKPFDSQAAVPSAAVEVDCRVSR